METASRGLFRFGVFELDATAGELRKRGIRIKLHAQPFQVLLMLLERPAEIVSRDEMRRRLWGEGTFVDFDHGLNTAINKLREALDDSASVPRYIETIAGKGYRFIAPVSAPPIQAIPVETPATTVLTMAEELPSAPHKLVKALLLLVQATYIAFYLGALANLTEVYQIFLEASLPPKILMSVLVTTAVMLIPVRLYLFTAAIFNFQQLLSKFRKLFPGLLILDLLWAFSPLLLIHHLSFGLALGISAALVYLPFAQRSLVLMYSRRL